MTANAQQREQWAREGEHWVREAERFDAMNDAFGRAMLDAAQLERGHRVLDVGCGNGATTLQAAASVSPGGGALGVDISVPMLTLARKRAAEGHADGAEFLDADAQVHDFGEASFDRVVSRFGTMFFDDPEAAFANLHRATKPGGRLAIVCWQDVLASEWSAVPGGAAAAHLGFPDFGKPGSPGPYGLSDPDRLRQVVSSGGFANLEVEAVTCPMRMGDDPDDVVSFFTSLDIVSLWFAEHPEEKVAAAVADVREALAPFASSDGVVMSGSAWLASAERT